MEAAVILAFEVITPGTIRLRAPLRRRTTGACAIKADDTVACWARVPYDFAVPPSGLDPVKQVSAGGFHTCVIKADDTIACWGENGSGQTTLPIVLNVRPTADAAGPYSGTEGGPVGLDGSGSTDSDGDALTYEWDFDYDGSTLSVDALGVAPTHSYPQDGDYTAALRVADADEAHTSFAPVTISNVLPAVSVAGPAEPVGLINGSAQVTIAVSFTDPGLLDPHATSVECGDGQSAAPATAGQYICTYTGAGVHTIAARVTDDRGFGEATFQYVVVYDPTGGFATGGGWIDYGADACPSLCSGQPGRAGFGFVWRYQKGDKPLTGNTRFEFHAGTLTFASTSYDWLVVAGSRAQFKGTGQINGAGDYGFMLTAVDGQLDESGDADLFRIKIWDRASDVIVYDNQAGAADSAPLSTTVGGGNIVIHIPKK